MVAVITDLHLEYGDAVVQHLDAYGEHLAALLGGGRRGAGGRSAAVYTSGGGVRVVHAPAAPEASAAAAGRRQLPGGGARVAVTVHPLISKEERELSRSQPRLRPKADLKSRGFYLKMCSRSTLPVIR